MEYKRLGLGAYRLILAWMVIASHTIGYYDLFNFDMGTIAVSTFFFISGYLMPLTFERNYAQHGLKTGISKFLTNRFIRIYPIYWATILIPLIISIIVAIRHGKWEDIGFSLTFKDFFQNILLLGLNQSVLWGGYERINNPAWTLDVELQYYLLVPFILLWFKKFKKLTICGLLFLSIVSIVLYFKPLNLVDIDRSFVAWAFFFNGGFFYFLIDENFTLNRNYYISLVIIAILVFSEIYFIDLIELRNFLYSVFFILLSIPLLQIQKDYLFNSYDKTLGDYSYPTYIIHFFVIPVSVKLFEIIGFQFNDLFKQFLLILVINILITTIISFFMIRFISDPIDIWRNKIRGKII